jgi:LacI family transcriptional regulator, repressor for deo operon, udp, cdd, tsx, nupC, and nupG
MTFAPLDDDHSPRRVAESAPERLDPPASTQGSLARATIEDVAARAQVSVATVSRALRGLPNVADATRKRVSEVATALNYRADPNASRLAAGKTMTIGMAVPLLGQWYFAQVVAGVGSALGTAGYDLLLMSAQNGEARRRFIQECALLQKRVDGLILVDLRLEADEVVALRAASAVVSTVGDSYPGFASVTIDNRSAAKSAVRHLIRLGHRRIGFIGTQPVHGRDFAIEFSVPMERRMGYRNALAEAGLPLDPAYEVEGDFTIDDGVGEMIEGGAIGMRRLLDLPKRPTAVFAMSDETAFGAMQVVREAGLRVPEDISVIGFDDHEVSGMLGLTTIRQPVVRSGVLAAQHLIAGLIEPTDVRDATLGVELILRNTTAPPAA